MTLLLTIFKHVVGDFIFPKLTWTIKKGKNDNHSNSNCSQDVYVLSKSSNIKYVDAFQLYLKNHAKMQSSVPEIPLSRIQVSYTSEPTGEITYHFLEAIITSDEH